MPKNSFNPVFKQTKMIAICCYLLKSINTLKEFRSSVRRTATESVQFLAVFKLVAETEVGNFDVFIAVHK